MGSIPGLYSKYDENRTSCDSAYYTVQIKQVFADETGLTKLMQDMTNMHANLKHDMLRLGMTPTPLKPLSNKKEK